MLRLPFAPVAAFLGDDTIANWAHRLDVTPHMVYRYQRLGVSILQADRIANHLGVHPMAIWGDDFHQGATR